MRQGNNTIYMSTHIHTHTHTDRQTDRQTHTHTHTHTTKALSPKPPSANAALLLLNLSALLPLSLQQDNLIVSHTNSHSLSLSHHTSTTPVSHHTTPHRVTPICNPLTSVTP